MLLATLRFAAFALLAIAGPGIAIQRIARAAVDPALVIPLGTAAAAGAWWLALVAGAPWLFPVLLVAAVALGVPGGPLRLAEGPPLRGAIAPVAATIALLALTQYGGNRVARSGEFLLDNLVPYDTAFHVGLTRELATSYPPQVPGVSGFPLGYHLGPDLVRAAALRWADVDPYDSINRLDVTLWAIGLILALRAVTRALGGNAFAVGLAGFIPLATDFSFVFARNPQAHWWADLLRGNVLLSLALSNPVVPALALALGALVALDAHARTGDRGSLLLAALQAAAVPFFKVFLGAHLLLGLGAAAALRRLAWRDVFAAGLPCAAATALLALGQGGATVEIAFDPLDLVRTTRASLELPALTAGALAAWSLFWLAASLGLRVLGLGPAVAALGRGSPAACALAAMALAAWPLGLLFRVSAPEMLAGQETVNDAAYLVEQGGPLLWAFTALTLAALAGPTRRGRLLTALVAAAVALPATAQFAWKKALLPYDPVPAPMVRAMDALERASAPGDVVLQRPGARYPPLPVVLAGRRVPYERFTPWLTQFAPREALEQRHERVFRFFRTTDREEAMAIARELDARFVALYGPDRLRFDTAGVLEPVHEEDGVRILRLAAP
jgi:hypothetical protein